MTTKKRAKTTKKKNKKNKTQKQFSTCPTQLMPFEKEFEAANKSKFKSGVYAKQIVKEVTSKPSPFSIRPNQDYYDYVNYLWLKEKHVDVKQKYLSQVDDFRLTQDKVYRNLDEIIVNYIKENKTPLARALNIFRKSVINMNPINYSKRLSTEAVNKIDDLIKNDNPWKMLAHFNKDEMTCSEAPFSFALVADDKQSTIFRCYVGSHSFFILDLAVYYDDGKEVEYKKRYRAAFAKNCQDIFDTCLGKGHGLNGHDIFDVEVEMFTALGCTDVAGDDAQNYNRVYAGDALSKYGFDWKEYTKELGFPKPPTFFVAPSLNYIKCGSKLLTDNWKTPKWRTYWIFILLKRICRLTTKWEKVVYQFYGNFQRGQEGINNSDAVSASLYMSVPFNKFLTEEYIKKYQDPENVRLVEVMCSDLKIVFNRILSRNTWMSPATKKKALTKLSQFKFIVGHYSKEREDPILDYNDNLYDNMIKIYKWRMKRLVKLEGNAFVELPQMDWTQYPVKMSGTQAYIVNASYTPTKNAIFINLGYMQPPFIEFNKGLGYTAAHLGFTIGHEMSHGFDDWGSKYDGYGILNDWWTAEDKIKFKKIQKDVQTQYEVFAKRDGVIFDASIGIGEDMADISGLQIITEYLQDYNKYIDNLPLVMKNHFEEFFIYYAYQQKQKIAKKALKAELKTNPHPLDKYRCNVPLSRNLVFRALYNVKKADKMWWHNADTIW